MSGHQRSGVSASQSVSLAIVSFSGHRYVAMADLGLAQPMPLMVHGNGRVYLSVTHPVAERLTGEPVRKHDDYGYTARGRGAIDVAVLRLGGRAFEPIADVPVFDFTDDPDAPVQGMLGTRFLTAERAAVDFATDTLLLGVASSADPNGALLERGYRVVPLSIGDDQRVTIEVTFPVLGRAVAIPPATVSNALTLHHDLFADLVPMAKAPAPDRSPGGSSPHVFTSDDVEFEVGGARCHEAAAFEDLAEYAGLTERELPSYGMLGFDWMKRHDAILDYANRRLLFRP